MNFVKKHLFTIVGITIGAISGYVYYYYVGCESGNCAITSSPINSVLYGGLMGGLLPNSFEKKATEKQEQAK
jgi:LytS/YehU family sensor histidine kinase